MVANPIVPSGISIDSEYAPGGIMVYYADGDEEIIHANQQLVELMECQTVDQFMELTGGTFKGFVHEEDICAVEANIWEQVKKKHGLDHVFYRVKTRTGRIISIDDYGRLVERPGDRPLFYVFLAIVDRHDTHDWLTGLPELAHFKQHAEIHTRNLAESSVVPAILAFDIMGMKNYNSTYGRPRGDVLLKTFADILRKHFDSDGCCRHAGDRFFAFANEDGVEEKISAVFAEFASSGLEGVPPLMGGACSFYPGDDVSAVLDRARLACDSDNTTWESHMTWFTDSMRDGSMLRSYVLEHLDQAIKNRWLRPFYQAIMRSSTGCVCCEEALARWVDPVYGTLSPSVFIPVLERAGLLQKLDMHMVDCILEDFAFKQEHGTPIVPVSVNISLRDLGKLDVAREIARKADAAGISHDLLKIEFTESASSEDPEQLREQIKELHEAGFEVWMDDFGSGYSSLNTLGEFNFDLLKLDMELIRNIGNERTRVIIAGTVNVAKNMQIGTLAEGVETEEQAHFLESVGCGMLQGFYFTKPLPRNVIVKHAAEGKGFERERLEEYAYWDKVGIFDLNNPVSRSEGWAGDGTWLAEFPAAIAERRGTDWRLVRANREYREFLFAGETAPEPGDEHAYEKSTESLDLDFVNAVNRSRASGSWERIAGRLEYGTGMQFYTKPIASAPDAEAFAIASFPAMLGTTLGSYGDVPVAYCVFKAILDEEGTACTDAEFVYANDAYCEALGFVQSDLPGRSFHEAAGGTDIPWLPYIYRAAILKEKVHGVLYGPVIDHWLSFNVAPSPVAGCCVFAYTIADDESREREEMMKGLTTSDNIIDIVSLFNKLPDYNEAMNGILEAMSTVIHPERLYVFERGETASDNTFEWCASGIEPEIDTLQGLDNSEFDTWERMIAADSIVFIPDVDALKGVDDRMHWQLSRQGINRMVAVPLVFNGTLLGYLGADNYVDQERLDTKRLLKAVAGFVAARIATQRMLTGEA